MSEIDTAVVTASAVESEAAGTPRASAARQSRLPQKRDKPKKHTWRRRGNSIRCYVGPNGSGKTFLGMLDLLPSIDAGRTILSTVPIYDSRTGLLYEHYIPFTSWAPLLDESFCHADIFMDEVTGIANSRDSAGMPRQVQTVLDKLRKRDLTLTWTAPSWKRADITIRSCTQAVTLCQSFFAAPDTEKRTSGEIASWRPKRLVRGRTFAAEDFEEFDPDRAQGQAVQKSRRLRARVVQWVWIPGSRAASSYDTFDAVSRVGEVLDSGRCGHCGGTRPIPKCSCE
jgi:hypothetical protein